jgi:hypothetical protein
MTPSDYDADGSKAGNPGTFSENRLTATPIQALGLSIEGSVLEPILEEFKAEIAHAGIRLQPHFYLSTEWGVNPGSISIAIPFYLARTDLIALHEQQSGLVEGVDRDDVFRYLRHELGHVVNYAYLLYEREDWVKSFGSFTQPYLEEYRPIPFSRRFVRHLPGWYAQKHPDEDWAETFAVWMTPTLDWEREYADFPEALKKIRYCARIMAEIRDREPSVTHQISDESVQELTYSVGDFYRRMEHEELSLPPGLDGALRAIFENLPAKAKATTASTSTGTSQRRIPASDLIRQRESELIRNVYRWTGHAPEHARTLLRHLARRADELSQGYPESLESAALLGLTTLVTALAMNHVHSGSYLP